MSLPSHASPSRALNPSPGLVTPHDPESAALPRAARPPSTRFRRGAARSKARPLKRPVMSSPAHAARSRAPKPSPGRVPGIGLAPLMPSMLCGLHRRDSAVVWLVRKLVHSRVRPSPSPSPSLPLAQRAALTSDPQLRQTNVLVNVFFIDAISFVESIQLVPREQPGLWLSIFLRDKPVFAKRTFFVAVSPRRRARTHARPSPPPSPSIPPSLPPHYPLPSRVERARAGGRLRCVASNSRD